ncbi:MAG TPA: DUF354 domain-containing protein [Chryseolinea sp.]|nr:DUF354 domain-containing protein [Chryseolinea sp.]
MKIWFDLSNSPHINLFHDLIRDLESSGHEIIITCRPLANTIDLLNQKGLIYTIIGEHYGKNFYKKLFGYPVRVSQLIKFLKGKKVDLAVSQSSFHSPLVARLLRIPSIYTNDNEHALGNIPSFIFATRILLPEYFSAAQAKKQGASLDKIVQYPGLKEGIYLWPIAQAIHNDRKKTISGSFKIYVRPEPLTAQYYKGAINFLDTLLSEIQDKYSIILLPRDKTQLHHYKQSKFSKITVAERPIALTEIASDCSLFVGAGGSMTRELACLGVPTISVYQDKLLEVDKFLIQNGFMSYEPNLSVDVLDRCLQKNSQSTQNNELMEKGKLAYKVIKSEILSFR